MALVREKKISNQDHGWLCLVWSIKRNPILSTCQTGSLVVRLNLDKLESTKTSGIEAAWRGSRGIRD